MLFAFKNTYVNPPKIRAIMKAKIKLPMRYCSKLFLIKSIVISDFSGKTLPPTKKEPIFRELKTIIGIIGGILMFEHKKANDLFNRNKTANEMTITV